MGMAGDSLPEHVMQAIGSEHKVMDLVYSPPDTPLLLLARAAGARAIGGLGMLVHQAGLAFRLFTGQPVPLDVMSAAAVSAVVKDLSPTADT
jgi:shikimate dehydrogenase